MDNHPHRWWLGVPVHSYRNERRANDLTRLGWIVAFALTFIILVGLAMLCFASKAHAEEVAIETIAREASGEPYAAQVAVAEVIKTRMVERHQTAEQVCLAPKQFSCWEAKQTPRTVRELATARRAWEQAKAGTANLYHDDSVRPWWAKRVKFVKRIGRLLFYREERGA